jgi:acetoin:2,6-dichlorophenolindophenol oxidoreductase subunit beta
MSGLRDMSFAEAVRDALDIALAGDPRVWVLGEGVTDPKAIFGTTAGLLEKYGRDRVVEMPVSESGMTGIALGSAVMGQRPVMIHQRVDFALYSFDQLINNAAKWHYMHGGQSSAPMVVRMLIGRGWGQGPQHAQSLEALFAHIPGLKVVMPVTPADAKGLLAGAIADGNPVVFLEHRWLHGIRGPVPEGHHSIPLAAGPRIARAGRDVTIAATSYMVLEALLAADVMEEFGVAAEVIDVRVLRPLDDTAILDSVSRTGALVTVDTGWKTGGFGAELVARAAEQRFGRLRHAPRRLGSPDHPSPSSRGLIPGFYVRAEDIVDSVVGMLGLDDGRILQRAADFRRSRMEMPVEQPDPTFKGPF